MRRYLTEPIIADLANKMVFLGGPRQVGKTQLSFQLLNGDESHPGYLNWDFPTISNQLLNGVLPGNEPLIVFDEIHKYPHWRNLVKGFYDTQKSKRQFLITGSARLDYYRRGGDSLQGRYHYYRLHPISLNEIRRHDSSFSIQTLLKFGGFPEPLLAAEESVWRRWQRERRTRVIHEDLQSLETVQDISKLNLLTNLLPERVGSALSLQSLANDLGVAHKTIARWLEIFENLYVSFRISPYGPPQVRAVKKEQKLYLYDWSLCLEPGPTFENLMASQLLKYCHTLEDTQGYEMELRYLRDTDKREVDFVVIKDGSPQFAVECKTKFKQLSKHIEYFAQRTPIPKFYQVHLGEENFEVDQHRAHIVGFEDFCKLLELP